MNDSRMNENMKKENKRKILTIIAFGCLLSHWIRLGFSFFSRFFLFTELRRKVNKSRGLTWGTQNIQKKAFFSFLCLLVFIARRRLTFWWWKRNIPPIDSHAFNRKYKPQINIRFRTLNSQFIHWNGKCINGRKD